MFTLIQVNAAAPPNSPLKQAAGDYWGDVLKAAERVVKSICRRKLELNAAVSDKGYTLEVDDGNGGTGYVYYLAEPTGSAIAYASFTTLKLNDDTVATADVTIEAGRLVFLSGGEVELVYPGGFMRDTAEAVPCLRRAVIMVMHTLHESDQNKVAADYATVREMLAPYVRVLGDAPYAERPE